VTSHGPKAEMGKRMGGGGQTDPDAVEGACVPPFGQARVQVFPVGPANTGEIAGEKYQWWPPGTRTGRMSGKV
jgi:hypothetical protein